MVAQSNAVLDGTAFWKLLGRSGVVAAMKAAQSGLMLVALAAAARWLGADAYGQFATILASAGVLAVVAQLGLPQHVLRRVAALEAGAAAGALRALLRRSVVAVVAGGAGVLIVVAAVCWTGPSIGSPATGLALGAVAAAPLALLRVLSAWLQARGRVVAGQVADALVRPGLLAVGMVVFARLDAPPSWTTAGWLVCGVTSMAALMAAWQVRAGEPADGRSDADETLWAWLAATAPLLGIALLHALMANADVLMLGALADAGAAGAYHAASRVALTLGLAMAALGAVTGPALARAAAEGDMAEVRRIAVTGARLLTFPAALALPVVALVAEPVLSWLGDGFAAGAPALIGLWIGQLVNLACGPVAVLLNCQARERAAFKGVALGTAANLALNAVLIPPLGATGAAIATASSTALWNLVLLGAVRRHTGVDPSVLGRPTRPMAA